MILLRPKFNNLTSSGLQMIKNGSRRSNFDTPFILKQFYLQVYAVASNELSSAVGFTG